MSDGAGGLGDIGVAQIGGVDQDHQGNRAIGHWHLAQVALDFRLRVAGFGQDPEQTTASQW